MALLPTIPKVGAYERGVSGGSAGGGGGGQIVIDKANAGTAADDATATTIAVNTNQTIASGAFIIASIGLYHASATLSSVAGGGLSWSIAVQGNSSLGDVGVAIAYAQAPSGLASGTTITATFSASVFGRQIGITSFTGVATSSPVDTTAAVLSSAGLPWTTGNVSIAAGSVLVGVCHLAPFAHSAITSPSIEALDWTDGAETSATMGYRIEASAGSYAVAGTWDGSIEHATVAAAFKVG